MFDFLNKRSVNLVELLTWLLLLFSCVFVFFCLASVSVVINVQCLAPDREERTTRGGNSSTVALAALQQQVGNHQLATSTQPSIHTPVRPESTREGEQQLSRWTAVAQPPD